LPPLLTSSTPDPLNATMHSSFGKLPPLIASETPVALDQHKQKPLFKDPPAGHSAAALHAEAKPKHGLLAPLISISSPVEEEDAQPGTPLLSPSAIASTSSPYLSRVSHRPSGGGTGGSKTRAAASLGHKGNSPQSGGGLRKRASSSASGPGKQQRGSAGGPRDAGAGELIILGSGGSMLRDAPVGLWCGLHQLHMTHHAHDSPCT
jgi:hypothetical protein